MRRNSGWLSRLAARAALLVGAVRSVGPAARTLREGENEPIDPTTRFEAGDVHVKGALLTGAGVLLVMWVIVLLVYPLYLYFESARAKSSPPPIQAEAHGLPQPPEPRLQADPQRDLKDFRAYENAQLSGYHWVNRAEGTVSIPIEQAMKMIAARGIPAQAAPPGNVYFDPQEGTRETGFEGKVEPR